MASVEIESQFPFIVIANHLPSINLSCVIPSFFLRAKKEDSGIILGKFRG